MGSLRKPSDERGMFSRLPDDSAYWERLSARIVDDAAGTLADYREEANGWFSVLGRFSIVLAAAASAALVVAYVALPADNITESRPPSVEAYGLAPTDPLAAPLLAAEAPPTMETLIAMRTAEEKQ